MAKMRQTYEERLVQNAKENENKLKQVKEDQDKVYFRFIHHPPDHKHFRSIEITSGL